jgi:pilus assembly protein Flp/PilA
MLKQLTRVRYSVTRFGVRLAKDESGAALVEYGLLVGLIAVVSIVAVTDLGSNVKTIFCKINTDLVASGIAGMISTGC